MANTIYRADHCGSLVRPPKLRAARLDYRRGRMRPQRELGEA